MSRITSPLMRTLAVSAILGGVAFATPSFAEGVMGGEPTSAMPPQQMTAPVSTSSSESSSSSSMASKKGHGAQAAADRVETRIQNLHEKLKITPEQESEWKDVAQAMRDNETSMSGAIEQRHQNAQTMSAVEDLQSYQKIAQAHADGLNKLISSFQTLYDDMSDVQKKNADEVFGRFEGHRGVQKTSMKSRKSKSTSPDTMQDDNAQ